MSAESDRLLAIIRNGRKRKAEAENPKTPMPQELELMKSDPAAIVEAPKGVTEEEKKHVGLDAIMRQFVPELHAQDVAQQKEDIKPIAEGVRDIGTKLDAGASVFADEATRGWASTARANVQGIPREQVKEQVAKAEAELGPTAAGAVGFAGTVAPYVLAGSAAAPAGLIMSGLTGGGLGAADVNIRSMAEEGDLSDADESLLAATFGAGGGVLGNVIGKGMAGLWTKLTAGKGTLPPHMQRSIQREADLIDEGGKAIDASGVQIKAPSLSRLLASIERKTQRATPLGTPKAWSALEVVRNALTLNKGETMTLRQLNDLRNAIRDKPKGKRYEQNITNEIFKTLNTYIDMLPNSPNAIASGDVKAGVEGWRKMNVNFQNKLKMDKIAEKLAFAEAKAKKGNITVDNAIQNEFAQWTTSKGGKKEFENVFTPEERKVLMPITEGNLTTRQLNAIDRVFAKNWFGQVVRLMRTGVAHVPASTAARRQVSEAFSKMPGALPTPPLSTPAMRLPQQVGTAAGADFVSQAASQRADMNATMPPGLADLMNPQ